MKSGWALWGREKRNVRKWKYFDVIFTLGTADDLSWAFLFWAVRHLHLVSVLQYHQPPKSLRGFGCPPAQSFPLLQWSPEPFQKLHDPQPLESLRVLHDPRPPGPYKSSFTRGRWSPSESSMTRGLYPLEEGPQPCFEDSQPHGGHCLTVSLLLKCIKLK